MLLVFKIIFLVVFLVGVLVVALAPFFYKTSKKNNQTDAIVSRKVVKLRLIGIIIAAVGLLVVLILSYFK